MSEFDWLDDLWSDTLADTVELETTRQLSRPKTHERREARRVMVNGLKRQALNELIPDLPDEHTDLWVIGNGAGAEIRHGINPQAFDFGSFIPHVVEMLGNRDCTAYVSTWTLNRNHALTMLEMLADNRLKSLTVCTDPYFKRRSAPVATVLIGGLQRYPGRARFLCWKNHVKAIAISNADEARFCTITGSANLSSQPRTENYVLSTSQDVYRFYVDEFFEAMLSREVE